jgi:hypothetical protein
VNLLTAVGLHSAARRVDPDRAALVALPPAAAGGGARTTGRRPNPWTPDLRGPGPWSPGRAADQRPALFRGGGPGRSRPRGALRATRRATSRDRSRPS